MGLAKIGIEATTVLAAVKMYTHSKEKQHENTGTASHSAPSQQNATPVNGPWGYPEHTRPSTPPGLDYRIHRHEQCNCPYCPQNRGQQGMGQEGMGQQNVGQQGTASEYQKQMQ